MNLRPLGPLVVFGSVLIVGVVVASRREAAEPAAIPAVEPAEPAPPVEPPPPAPEPPPPAPAPPPPVAEETSLVEPVAEFKARITKKPFGIYITPETSPVQPEKFTGYHNAVDVEYEDVAGDVPVRAISEGEVVVSRTASGYGGVMVVRHTINGEKKLVLYGHLDPKSTKPVGATVTRGEQIAILGGHKSAETDGERKHLHFAILAKSTVDLRGYVQNKSELSGWHDPLTFY